MDMPIVIVSRQSRLAMWQAEYVLNRLKKHYPNQTFSILSTTTRGDEILNQPLAKIGGKGLFIKELEVALLNKQAHLAVHSMKDVPMQMPEGFALPFIFGRENPFDALVSNHFENLQQLPAGAVVGTSSLRRESQLRCRFPHLKIKSLRGNLDTRLKKLDQGEFDAIILAATGLERLNLHNRIRSILPIEQSIPAPGQGALGIEILENQSAILQTLHIFKDETTACCVLAERAFSRVLGGSCQVPLGAYAVLQNNAVFLRAFVGNPEGTQMLYDEQCAPINQAEELGKTMAEKMLSKGADAILKKILG